MITQRKLAIKICAVCGKSYFRRNLTEMWMSRNPGHRAGWAKEIVKVCMNCQSVEDSRRMLTYVGVSFKPKRRIAVVR